VLHLHQVVQGTRTPKPSDMSDTQGRSPPKAARFRAPLTAHFNRNLRIQEIDGELRRPLRCEPAVGGPRPEPTPARRRAGRRRGPRMGRKTGNRGRFPGGGGSQSGQNVIQALDDGARS
jgi:hypothetical protein